MRRVPEVEALRGSAVHRNGRAGPRELEWGAGALWVPAVAAGLHHHHNPGCPGVPHSALLTLFLNAAADTSGNYN